MSKTTTNAVHGPIATRLQTGVSMKHRAQTSVGAGGKKIKFGSVVVSGSKPDKKEVVGNIQLGIEALERVSKSLLKPGVTIRAKKNVPQYSVADGEPGVFIRRLNGRVDRGRLVDGVFQVTD